MAEDSRFVVRSTPLEIAAPSSIVCLIVRSGIEIDDKFLNHFPNLRYLIRAGSGVDNIDVRFLRSRGIHLIRNPNASAKAVAELASAALIMLARRIPQAHLLLQRGVWAKSALQGEAISEFHVAVWGSGPVGRACYTSLTPHCSRVTFEDTRTYTDEKTFIGLSRILKSADVHMLCLPLLEETTGFVNSDFLDTAAPKSPYIINVGRWDLCVWESLVSALKQGTSRGVFVDPIEESNIAEVSTALQGDDSLNLLVSQHLGAQRRDVLDEVGMWAVNQAKTILGSD